MIIDSLGGSLVSRTVLAGSENWRTSLYSLYIYIRGLLRKFCSWRYILVTIIKTNPVGIWCQNVVVLMSMRRHHIASTVLRRHFPSCALWGTFDRKIYQAMICLYNSANTVYLLFLLKDSILNVFEEGIHPKAIADFLISSLLRKRHPQANVPCKYRGSYLIEVPYCPVNIDYLHYCICRFLKQIFPFL